MPLIDCPEPVCPECPDVRIQCLDFTVHWQDGQHSFRVCPDGWSPSTRELCWFAGDVGLGPFPYEIAGPDDCIPVPEPPFDVSFATALVAIAIVVRLKRKKAPTP